MLTLVSGPEAWRLDLEACDPAAAVAALEARELRLLAYAIGEHLPVELALMVAELRARRAALLGVGG